MVDSPPGAGKSLLAACLPGILPDLTPSEALEVSMVASVAGELPGGRLVRTRPFRAPHHSASMAALTGGGHRARPGEVSLAHLGILFLDEAPEFSPKVIEALRTPLEAGSITLGRSEAQARYPAKFQLIMAANPCPCGQAATPGAPCQCPPNAVRRYADKISGPIRDRMNGLLEDRGAVSAILAAGGAKASALAAPTLRAAQEAVGLQV